MIYKIFTVGKDKEELESIGKILARNKLYEVKEMASVRELREKVHENQDTNLIIFDFDVFTSSILRLITDIKGWEANPSFMILSKIHSNSDYRTIKLFEKTVLLEKPYTQKDLWGVVGKLTQGREVSQRIHRRFETNQNAVLEQYSRGSLIPSRLENLSRGGGYFVHDGSPLNSGELLRVSVELSEVSRQYQVDAKVVWANENLDGQACAGVKFLKTGDVYRNLLGRL